ncbi:MAG TPA: helix-turn-helix domain-containing protein [Acidimicrobiales bacterium]|jgi:AcrR family transcriptional regulator|nr:helix-turn-helix domain-containing protein [Acidimicrobiales bacterium]
MAADPAEVLTLPVLTERLPLPPDPALNPVLDAAARCLARHGISKTTLSDIAREMGVAPSTVYRKVGSVDNVTMLIFAREAQRFLERIPATISTATGPQAITALMTDAIETLANDPVAAKVLRDEGDWMGRMVTRQLDHLLAQGVEVAAPLLAAAMAAGLIRSQDPERLAHWLLRIALAALVAPPPGDLRSALDDLLVPVLER